MEKLQPLLELLRQRRFWASISALMSVVLPAYGVAYDVEQSTETLLALGSAISILFATILPAWSLLKPKNKK